MGVFSGPRAAVTGGQPARDYWGISGWGDLVPPRPAAANAAMPVVTFDSALRNSAVWACLSLRAGLVSTFPIDVYRNTVMPDGSAVKLPVSKSPVLIMPGGEQCGWPEWAHSTQVDIDRAGNTVGRITERDGFGLPARIDLWSASQVHVLCKGNVITGYRVGSDVYAPADVWHEKGFTVAGIPVGLSPVAYAAYSAGLWQSAQEFALTWFAGGGVPRARLRNTQKTLDPKQATVVKESWRASIAAGEPFTHGNDWEYDLLQAQEMGSAWLEATNASVVDVARYFGCPADLIDSITATGGKITYANITQLHLQFLILRLGPSVARREWALTRLTPQPRFVKMNTDALLRMDPLTRAQTLKTLIDARLLCPSEGRELDDRQPYTAAQLDEFAVFWPPKGATPGAPAGPAAITPATAPALNGA